MKIKNLKSLKLDEILQKLKTDGTSLKNRRFLFVISALLMILTSLPYFYGYTLTPPRTIFLGNGFFNSHDYPVYYSYIEQIKNGAWLLKDVFTAETGQKPFLNIFWLGLGLTARIFSLNPILIFHLARIFLIPLFVFVVNKFLDLVFQEDKNKRKKIKLALALFFFTAGWGGFLSLWQKDYQWPLEVWWPEAYGFFSAYASPHFLASWILIVASLYYFIRGLKENSGKKIILAGFLGALLGQFHAFYLALLLPLSLIFILYCLPKQKEKKLILWRSFLYSLSFLPVIIYYFYLLTNDKIMTERLFESQMLSPNNFLIIFFAFGFNLTLALISAFLFFKKNQKSVEKKIIVLWALTVPFLLLAPLPFQKRLIEGWQLPVIILTTETLFLIFDKFAKKTIIKYCQFVFILIFFILPAGLVWFFTLTIYRHPQDRLFYLPTGIYQSLQWLKKTDQNKNSVVLAAPATSLAAAFVANKTVYWGHKFETVRAREKVETLQWFFDNNDQDETTEKFLKYWRVKYLIWGAAEKKAAKFKPEEKKYLDKIYADEGVEIYKY